MKKVFLIILIIMSAANYSLHPQRSDSAEITAQTILARVDRIMQYPAGEIQGNMKHIYPDGKSFDIDFKGLITISDFLFSFKSSSRGESLKVLYNMGGEDIWVYNIHALQLFHKMGIDKYDSVILTNFSFIDMSNSNFQSNYNAKIMGKTLIKGIECYRLNLDPIFDKSEYGLITLYATVDQYLPLRIDYHDRDKVVFKFQSLAKTMEKAGRIIPIRYDMLNIKNGTVTILNFNKFEEDKKFTGEIFRPEKLGE
ncbi:MAG: outer membrane lipoprotein-sorting protein [Leptospirales bacterium]|nr:outer membrane lipoprotein-sorting protein [Leptospirales bacterium]